MELQRLKHKICLEIKMQNGSENTKYIIKSLLKKNRTIISDKFLLIAGFDDSFECIYSSHFVNLNKRKTYRMSKC